MIPRQPPDASEDDVQNELLQAIHEALSDTAPAAASADDQSLAGTNQDNLALQGVWMGFVDTDIELDRTEAYLRGPTAFTA